MRRWFLVPSLLALAAVASADGAATAPAPAAPPAAPAAPAAPRTTAERVKALAEHCRYVPTPFVMSAKDPVKFGPNLTAQALEYPSPVKSVDPERNDTVRAKLFTTATPEAAAVICLGGWRRDPITPMLGAKIAEATNLQVLYIELPFQGERTPKGKRSGEITFSADIDQNHATFEQAAQDVGRAVDWLIQKRGVDPKRLGIIGTSLGGWVSADLYGLDDRFAAAVIQIAGGDVASAVFNGNFLTQNVRADFLAKGVTEAEVREQMRALDPATWARKERKDGILLLAAEFDEIVELPTVKALAEAYGGARLVVMPGARHIDPKSLEAHLPETIKHLADRLIPARDAKAPAPETK